MQVCMLSPPSGKTHCSYVCSCRERGGSTVIVCSQEHSCCLTFYQGTDLELSGFLHHRNRSREKKCGSTSF